MKSHQSYTFEQVAANFLINFSIAYGLSTLKLSDLTSIPFTAPSDDPFHPNIAGELIVGTIITGLAVTLIVTFITRLLIKAKRLNLSNVKTSPFVQLLPTGLFKRGLTLGSLAAIFAALPLCITMYLLNIHSVPVKNYLIWHSWYVALLGSVLAFIACLKAFDEFSSNKPM